MNIRKNLTASLIALSATLLLSGAAFAGNSTGSEPSQDLYQVIRLDASKLGQQIGAQGLAVRSRVDGLETFGIRFFGDLKDGMVLVVEVEKPNGKVIAGTITTFLGSGSLVIDSRQQSAVFPVEEIRHITVSASEGLLLQGGF